MQKPSRPPKKTMASMKVTLAQKILIMKMECRRQTELRFWRDKEPTKNQRMTPSNLSPQRSRNKLQYHEANAPRPKRRRRNTLTRTKKIVRLRCDSSALQRHRRRKK